MLGLTFHLDSDRLRLDHYVTDTQSAVVLARICTLHSSNAETQVGESCFSGKLLCSSNVISIEKHVYVLQNTLLHAVMLLDMLCYAMSFFPSSHPCYLTVESTVITS